MRIQPTDGKPLLPVEIENELVRLGNVLETISEAMAKQGREAGLAEVAYRKAKATARLKSDRKSGEDREAEATLEASEAYEKHRIASALYDAMRDRSMTIRTQIEILRTVCANVRHSAG